jgi:tetratricopeptide (TPR) repeat protein
MKPQKILIAVIGLLVLVLLCAGVYLLPPVHSRIAWRLASLQTKIHYFLNPPDQVVFSPIQEESSLTAESKPQISEITPSATFVPTETPTPIISPTITLTPTAIPAVITLPGVPHEYQSFNNCGPANLSMLLNYWDWEGNQLDTKAILRPNEDDANVMPEEMLAFVEEHTQLLGILRQGGDLELIKRLVAAGFPVMIEIGHHPPKDWWMGHYVVVNGYDDAYAALITQDSLIMADFPYPYHDLEIRWWRDFNNVYLVVYPPEREHEVASILGADFDPTENLQRSLQKTEDELPALTDRDLFFGLLNQAETLFRLGRIDEAATIFDQAFAHYNTLDDKQRPWRVLWYRVDAYQTYYETNRYQAVIDLARSTLSMLNKRSLEESHYWRGMAYEALGDIDKAREDYQIALQLRPTYQDALEALNRIK